MSTILERRLGGADEWPATARLLALASTGRAPDSAIFRAAFTHRTVLQNARRNGPCGCLQRRL